MTSCRLWQVVAVRPRLSSDTASCVMLLETFGRKNMQTLCLAVIGIIVLGVAGYYWRWLSHTVPFSQVIMIIQNHTDRFLCHCSYLNSRSNSYNLRFLWNIMACLILPAFISGFIYIQICRVLLNRDRNESRNKAFSITFFLDRMLWILCWSIYYFFNNVAFAVWRGH